MLLLITSIVSFVLSFLLGFYVIKNFISSEENLCKSSNLVLLLISVLFQLAFYNTNYSTLYLLIVYIYYIIIYRNIFGQKIYNSIILVTYFYLLMIFVDVVLSLVFSFFVDVNFASIWYFKLITSLIVFVITIILSKINGVQIFIKNFISKTEDNKMISTIIFLVLMTLIVLFLISNFILIYGMNEIYLISLFVIFLLCLLLVSFINEKKSCDEFMINNDNLFSFIEDFESRIEEEQFKNHEHKNQLAIIMSLSNEKEVIDEIKKMINDEVNVEREWIKGLQYVPRSIFKGIIFYKLSKALKNDVNVTIDISKSVTGYLEKLDKEQLRVLSNLLGIYFDNAIEEATLTDGKNVTFEIYISKKVINIVISNSINGDVNIDDMNRQGFSSKGKNRGRGLYFAKKIIVKNNDWLTGSQIQINDNYYSQRLIVKNRNM